MCALRRPSYRRRKLGKRLKALRESAGLSMEDAAKKPDKPRTSLLRIESYVDVEIEAARVSEYACQVVPGLLQTKDYIRAVIEGSRTRRTPEHTHNQVTVRLIRQERLTSRH